MKEIMTEIDIDASPERVWDILTDFPSYVLWNPFIHRAYGSLKEGEKIEVHVHTPGGEETTFFPTLTKVVLHQELSWLARLYLPGLLDSVHTFLLESRGEHRTHLIHKETFNGILVAPLMPSLEGPTRRGFEEMDQALKARAEAQPASGEKWAA